MWGPPMFDLRDAAGVLAEAHACRKAFPQHYIKVNAFDATKGVESMQLSFIVNRPPEEPGSASRAPKPKAARSDTASSYATDKPEEIATREPRHTWALRTNQ